MVGFAAYNFEGIGIVMPVMQRTAVPEMFDKLLAAAIGTMFVTFVSFGTVCYLAYGSDMVNEQIVTEMLPADNGLVIFLKLAFCINMLFSYIIHIKPCNMIVEAWLFKSEDDNAHVGAE